jgi:hypothetical protein
MTDSSGKVTTNEVTGVDVAHFSGKMALSSLPEFCNSGV